MSVKSAVASTGPSGTSASAGDNSSTSSITVSASPSQKMSSAPGSSTSLARRMSRRGATISYCDPLIVDAVHDQRGHIDHIEQAANVASEIHLEQSPSRRRTGATIAGAVPPPSELVVAGHRRSDGLQTPADVVGGFDGVVDHLRSDIFGPPPRVVGRLRGTCIRVHEHQRAHTLRMRRGQQPGDRTRIVGADNHCLFRSDGVEDRECVLDPLLERWRGSRCDRVRQADATTIATDKPAEGRQSPTRMG